MSKNSKQKMALRKKRHPSKPTTTTAENKSKQKQKPTADLNWKSISSKIRSVMIEVPFELSTKEARKFRKDKRREAREKGDAEPTFTNATSATVATREKSNAEESNQQLLQKTGGKRKRPSYAPSIRDLLEKERESAKLEAVKREHEKEEEKLSTEERAKYIALDCEMVGIGTDGKRSALARVSIIGWDGEILLDKFVKVPDRVSDFRTWVSGVRAKDLKGADAISPEDCRTIAGNMFRGKVLVGHSIKNDLEALMLTHPRNNIRDTARYKPFMKARGTGGGKLRPRKLKELAEEYLGLKIQVEGEAHSSIDDAQATMQLYRHVRSEWELDIVTKRKK